MADEKDQSIESENFAVELAGQCKTHDQWLAIVRFGMKTLLENPPLLMELIVREANKEKERNGRGVASDYAYNIMREIGLRFTV